VSRIKALARGERDAELDTAAAFRAAFEQL
jgi:hypothetical protein